MAARATLGTTFIVGRAVSTTASLPFIEVQGHLAGVIGVEFTGSGGDLHLAAGGSVYGSSYGVDSKTSILVQNEGSNSGWRAMYVDGGLTLINAGNISGSLDAVFVIGDATITNTGLISAPGIAVFVDGVASITNLGVIAGGVSTQDQADVLVNRGTITGNVQLGLGNDLMDAVGGRVGGTS